MKRKTEFVSPEKQFYSATGAAPDKTALDFWIWAYSDMIQNITRGIVAEYLVYCATDVESKPRDPWNYCDIETKRGTKIEVKSTGYVEAWPNKSGHKRIPAIALKATKKYNPESGEIAKDKTWNADKYVICYHKEEDINKADPMDADQWNFWVLDRKDIEIFLKVKKSISISSLSKNYKELDYGGLKNALKGI